jgi:hypothetical protein
VSTTIESLPARTLRVPIIGEVRRDRAADAIWALGAMALTAVVAAWVLRLWDADLNVPLATPEGDTGDVLSVVQSMLQHGWIFTNPSLGAPAGQELYDLPGFNANALHFVLMQPLAVFTSDAVPIVNAYFLLAFPLCALSGFALMRWMGVGRPPALVCSTLFALAPYHFLRGEWHLFLGAYFLVPVAAYLILAVYADRPLFARRLGAEGPLSWLSARTGLTLAACVAVAFSDLYYAAFTILLIAAAGLLTFAATRSRRALATSGVLVAVLAITLAAAFAPTLAYRLEHGSNPEVAREPEESLEYSTNLADLVFPVRDHRLGALDRLDERYTGSVPVGHEVGDQLGIVAAVGLAWLLVMVLAWVLRRRPDGPDPRYRHLAVATVTALLIGTTGGGSAIVAYLVSPQLRAWNRISIFITLFALLAVALLLDALRARVRNQVAAGAAMSAVLIVGVLDQTTPSMAPQHGPLAAQWRSDDAFVSQIEARLAPGTMVLQLPYVPYPEHPPVRGVGPYSHLRGYLHAPSLRWSFGAMKGRDDDWLAPVSASPVPVLVREASQAGFEGVWVDRFGYVDDGVEIERRLTRALGVQPVVSPDGRLTFFDMRRYEAEVGR